MDYWKQKKEWIEAFKEARDITRFFYKKIQFKKIKGKKNKINSKQVEEIDTVCEVGKRWITVNKEILHHKYSKNIKLIVMMHEFGHDFDDYHLFPILNYLTFGIYGQLYHFFNKEKMLQEFLADKFAEFTLRKRFGTKKGKKLYQDYINFFL